jgi:hypothetical protein
VIRVVVRGQHAARIGQRQREPRLLGDDPGHAVLIEAGRTAALLRLVPEIHQVAEVEWPTIGPEWMEVAATGLNPIDELDAELE